MPSPYPTLDFLVRHRRSCAIAGTALLPVVGGCVAWRTGWPEVAFLGAVLGLAAAVVVRSYLELVALVSDMLLPK